jgi:hypothetical protein
MVIGRGYAIVLGALLLWSAGVGCRSVGDKERNDARVLQEVLAADQALEAALRDADAVSRTDEAKAAETIENRAIPLADQVIERATAVQTTSPWGAERKAELEHNARMRRQELPHYARALRGADLKTKLEALEAQLELQRKAMEAAAKVSQAPN